MVLLVTTALFSSVYAQEDSVAITISAVGDIMPSTSFPSKTYLVNGNRLFEQSERFLKTTDLTFGNLEGCYLDDGPVVKKCKDTTQCYAFRTPESYFKYLVDAGFNMTSIANNHVFDFGLKGVKKTVLLADEANIAIAGATIRPYDIITKNDLKIGLCAFSPNKGTLNINDYDLVQTTIRNLKAQCDIVVVSFHGGAEGKNYQHVTREQEEFCGENRGNVHEFARIAIDAGGDVIIGHGPHVLRAIDIYKNRIIFYSLGNFCTPVRMNLQGVNGFAVIAQCRLTRTGEFIDGELVSFIQEKGTGPIYDEGKQAIRKIKELTEKDIPEAELEITNEGLIKRKEICHTKNLK